MSQAFSRYRNANIRALHPMPSQLTTGQSQKLSRRHRNCKPTFIQVPYHHIFPSHSHGADEPFLLLPTTLPAPSLVFLFQAI